MIHFRYIRAATVKSAIDAVTKETSTQFLAGGTNLVDLMKKGVTNPEKIVDITNLDLKKIDKDENKLRIGALALNSEVADYNLVRKEQPLRIFYNNEILYYDQPVALVIANTYERVRDAAMMIKVQHEKTEHHTAIHHNLDKAKLPNGDWFADYKRGETDACKNAAIKIEQEYELPAETHSPMELGSIIAQWEGGDRVTVYTKTQGVQDT